MVSLAQQDLDGVDFDALYAAAMDALPVCVFKTNSEVIVIFYSAGETMISGRPS